jgi:hypothetical protein
MAAPATHKETPEEINLGILDGVVSHTDINRSIAASDSVILFGEQTRLPHFPEDRRLARLHAADPLVLFFWRVLKKVPEFLRNALVDGPLSITLIRGDSLLHFRDVRCHQAVHIGRRRQTIYLPEVLLHQAEEMGYNHWSIAEGVIYASWMLFDYLLLADVLTAYGERSRLGAVAASSSTRENGSSLRLSEPLLRHLVVAHNRHRRVHPDTAKSETEEFIEGYRHDLIRVQRVNTWTREPWEIARDVFRPELERRWAQSKMERIADIFEYPRMFLFDRDIIHGAALDLARRQGQSIEPASFGDALHDYRDSLRFDPHPLMTEFCQGIVPKPRAIFLTTLVELGAAGLRGFFFAYRDNVAEAHDLIHALWSYLVSLTSDPAGVYSRVGKCRALCRPPGAKIAGGRAEPASDNIGPADGLDRELAGILVRLDLCPGYLQKSQEVVALGDSGRQELLDVIAQHGLVDTDEWATFKIKKQAIVSCACALLDQIDGEGQGRDSVAHLGDRRRLHEDETIVRLLADHPHRQTSDPSGVLMYTRSYARTLAAFGSSDPDANFQLASVLVRLDLSDRYEELLARIPSLGPPAVSALYEVLDQISERDERRRPILLRARQLLGSILLEKQLRSKARQHARPIAQATAAAAATKSTTARPAPQEEPGEHQPEETTFVGLQRELLTGTAFLERGGTGTTDTGEEA